MDYLDFLGLCKGLRKAGVEDRDPEDQNLDNQWPRKVRLR